MLVISYLTGNVKQKKQPNSYLLEGNYKFS